MKHCACIFLIVGFAAVSSAQQPTVSQIVNAASLVTPAAGVSPGSLVSIFGTNLGASSMTALTNPLPTSLGGVSVTFDEEPARILFVSSGQINLQVPWGMLDPGQQSRTARVVVTSGGRASAAANVQVTRYSPALFTLGQNGAGPLIALNSQDGSFAQPAGSVQGAVARPAMRGAVVSLYANGLGAVVPAVPTGQAPVDPVRRTTTPVEVLIGGRPAQVLFSGMAASVAGANHINVVVPLDAQPGNAVPVQLRMAGVATSAATTIAVDAAAADPASRPGPVGAEVWSSLIRQNFRQNFKLWPDKGQLYAGIEPHGMLLTTYVNQLAYDAIVAKAGAMPAGAMIVKENYMPDRTLAATTLMYKVPGFDADNNDWFWMTRNADGAIANEGRVAGCSGCHRLASGNDFLYLGSVVPPPAPNGAAVRDFLRVQNYRQTWRRWPGTAEFYAGTEPHGSLLTTYVNPVAFDAINRKTGTLPPGSIIVKESYMPDKSPAAMTVMLKSPGFDPANNDWYWQMQMPDGTVSAQGRLQDCIGCHRQASANDLLFSGSLASLPEPRAAAVWQYIDREKYQQNWKLMPATQAFSAGTQPHGSLVTTYVNPIALDAITGRRSVLPPGSIVIKENYMPDRTLAAVTVMYKSEGYDPDRNDWYWLQRMPDGTVAAEGRVRACYSCHSAVAAKDYLYTAPPR